MLSPFIEAYCNGNFDPVFDLMHGELDKEFRWRVILEEYSYLMKTEDGDHILSVASNVFSLRYQIDTVNFCCDYLQKCNEIKKQFDPAVVDRISEFYPADYSDPVNITLALTMVETKMYEYELMNEEYKRITMSTGSGEAMTEDKFYQDIAALSKEQGGGLINLDNTSVKMYAAAYQNLLTRIKKENIGRG